MGNEDIIYNSSTLNKRILKRINKVVHKGFKSVNQQFRYDFVNDIAKANRSKVRNLLRRIDLGNEGNERMVKGFKKKT